MTDPASTLARLDALAAQGGKLAGEAAALIRDLLPDALDFRRMRDAVRAEMSTENARLVAGADAVREVDHAAVARGRRFRPKPKDPAA